MYTDRRDRGERKKKGFFLARHDRGLIRRRKQQQKIPLAPRVSGAMLSGKFFRF